MCINKLITKDSLKSSLPIIFLVVGIPLFIVGILVKNNGFWDLFCERLSDILLVGAFLGFLLNSARFMGLFKRDLEDIIYGKDFMGARKDLVTVWTNLSLHLFREKFPQINKELVSNIKKAYLSDDEIVYYKDYDFTIKIEWVDKERETVKLTESVVFEIHSDTIREIPLIMESCFFVSDKSRIEECYKILQYEVNGNSIEPKEEKEYNENTKEFHYKATYQLVGKNKYDVIQKREKVYSLADDCDISFFARYIIQNMTVRVIYPEDISLYLRERGTIKPFKNIPSATGLIQMKYSGIMLPRQGLIFIVRPRT